MNSWEKIFGVNIFLDKVNIELIKGSNPFKSAKFKYIVEIVEGEDHSNNGYDSMNIYTDGELKILQIGNWKVSPVVRMPFNWQGYSVSIDISNSNNENASISSKPDGASLFKKDSYIPEIHSVFESVNELLLIEDKEQFDLTRKIKGLDKCLRVIRSVWEGNKPIPIGNVKEACVLLEDSISEFQNKRSHFKPEFSEYIKKKLNELIITFNQFNAEFIE